MKAEEIVKLVGYKPDELILDNVLTVGDYPADRGEEVQCKVCWNGTILEIGSEVNEERVLLLFTDDQMESLIKFWNGFEHLRKNVEPIP